jgi:cytochrome c oxidase assembly protein Cox11
MDQVNIDKLAEVLTETTRQTQSELIRFFIIAAVVLIVLMLVSIPIYRMMSKRDADKRSKDADNYKLDKYIEREKQIITVIQQNTEVIAGLKMLLTQNTTHCEQCRAEQMGYLDLITSKTDDNRMMLTELITLMKVKD